VIAAISPPAAAVLAICLLIAGVVAPALAGRAAATQEALARQRRSERDTSAMIALEHAPELRVAGALPDVIAESQRRQHAWGAALDAAARPAAIGKQCPPRPSASACLARLSRHRTGTHRRAHHPGNSDVVAAGGIRGDNSPAGGRRPVDTVADRSAPLARPGSTRSPDRVHEIRATTGRYRPVIRRRELRSPDRESITQVTLDLPAGGRLAITGASGSGKTTLLMTLAGLLPPLDGHVLLGGADLSQFDDAELHSTLSFFAEDAHIFATTVRDTCWWPAATALTEN